MAPEHYGWMRAFVKKVKTGKTKNTKNELNI